MSVVLIAGCDVSVVLIAGCDVSVVLIAGCDVYRVDVPAGAGWADARAALYRILRGGGHPCGWTGATPRASGRRWARRAGEWAMLGEACWRVGDAGRGVLASGRC